MAVERIDGNRAAELLAEGAVVIDVREAEDYAAGHIEGAASLPFNDLTAEAVARVAPDVAAPVVVYCYVGGRSSMVAQALSQAGYDRVYDLGGMSSWPFGFVTEEA